MIPLTKCPGCQGPFKRINHNPSWHQEICENRCPLLYQQFHPHNFEDNEIGYFIFYTEDFQVYIYVDQFGIKDTIHIYNRVFPRGEYAQRYIFCIPRFEIDWDKLNAYNKRWKLWKTFS